LIDLLLIPFKMLLLLTVPNISFLIDEKEMPFVITIINETIAVVFS